MSRADYDVFMSPLPPLKPTVTDGEARRLDYPVGYNISYMPRSYEGISFEQLRMLADTDYLTRTCIETRKDQVSKLVVHFGLKKEDVDEPDSKVKKRSKSDSRVDDVRKFFDRPDGEHDFHEWMRLWFEDQLVADCASLLVGRDPKSQKVTRFVPTDGGIIGIRLGPDGTTPKAPFTAYQQIVKGQILCDLNTNQLVYMPRNLRTHRVYGMSPVEQIIFMINLGLRRDVSRLAEYTSGTIPDAIAQVPPDWSPDQIERFQRAFDAALEGNLAARRMLRFIPSLGEKGPGQITFAKKDMLLDQFEEWRARIVAFCFSLPPTAFVKMMNRASGQQQQRQALEEGFEPSKVWILEKLNYLIQAPQYLNFPDIEASFDDDVEVDPLVQAQVDKIYISCGKSSVDELRIRDGEEPWGIGPFILTQTGPIMLDDVKSGDGRVKPGAPKPMLPPANGANGGAPGAKTPPAKPPLSESRAKSAEVANKFAEALAKAEKKKIVVTTGKLPARVEKRIGRLAGVLGRFLKKQGKAIAAKVADHYAEVTKTDEDEIDRIVRSIELEWDAIVTSSQSAIEETAQEVARDVLVEVGVTDKAVFDQVNQAAVDFARDRAAEMVGMKWDGDTLIENPNPRWAITDTTRDALRDTVTRAFEDGLGPQALEDSIADSFQFSETRAEMIARTELAKAQIQGALLSAASTGIEMKKASILGSMHDGDDECDDAADDGEIDLDETFSTGDDGPPYHPNCCLPGTLVAACDRVTKQFRRRFHGEVAVIRVASGEELSITKNHPVLTDQGWVNAGCLKKGVYLAYAGEQVRMLMSVSPNHNLMPALAEDVFSAALKAGGLATCSMPVTAEDFHGDGTADTEVEIVLAEGTLENKGQFHPTQHISENSLGFAHGRGMAFPSVRSFVEFSERSLPPASSIVSEGSNKLSLAGRHESVGCCLADSDLPDGQTEVVESIANSAAVRSDHPTEINRRLSGHIEFVEITDVGVAEFDGHVYNLQTDSSYYLANGLIVHNCVCDLVITYAAEAE